ncbi:unnamed protein product [Phytophthora lilii]|uniref:Unnamed protein product n=1 Tax=Phytophthora lilii TaxID=2077276 RepID=A0A9W6UAV6_9STRA|nr:unnamed protein product [Phytophthora lilii]
MRLSISGDGYRLGLHRIQPFEESEWPTYPFGLRTAFDSYRRHVAVREPRWVQSTYAGRAKHFLATTNPLNVLASDAQLDAAKQLVEEYKAGLHPALGEDEIWRAKQLVDSAFHPDTGKKNILAGRMAFQVPGNMIITGCMMTFYRSTPADVFLQFMNQTFNSIINYTNRNASTGVSKEQLHTRQPARPPWPRPLDSTAGCPSVPSSANGIVGRASEINIGHNICFKIS